MHSNIEKLYKSNIQYINNILQFDILLGVCNILLGVYNRSI